MRTLLIACFVAMLSPAPKVQAQQAAPFCLVSETGNRSCFYYSLQACRQAAVSLGGMCADNSQTANAQQSNPWTSGQQVSPLEAMNQVQAAGDAGRRRGEEQREARLRAELLEAQIERERADAAYSRIGAQPTANPRAGGVLYRCIGQDGIVSYTNVPKSGCVVVSTFGQQVPKRNIPLPSDRHLSFHGYSCTQDCSGHEAGYEWAEEEGIDDEDDCTGWSQSFIEGCQAYVEENH